MAFLTFRGNSTSPTKPTSTTAANAALTNAQIDGNFASLNDSKIETSDATSANTASKVVSRDASGNFSAGTITAELSGNASTATALKTARNINGVLFNGSADITITANTTNTLTRGSYLTGSNFNGSSATTWAVDATSTNAGSNIVARDASGNFSAGTITATLNGASSKVEATVSGTSSAELVRGNMADNDQFRILVGGTASNAGFVEFATADDGTEPIYVRQYGGVFSYIIRTATLLDGSGNTAFPGTLTANQFQSLSDENKKKNIETITNATDTLKQLRGVEFEWKDDNTKSAGVIAQELEKVLPHLVNTDSDNTKTVNYSGLIAYLIQSNRELSDRISALESRA